MRINGGLDAAVEAGILERGEGGVYRVLDWQAFNRVTDYFMVETIP